MYDKADLVQQFDDSIGFQAVGVERHGVPIGMFQMDPLVASLEGEQEKSIRAEHPVELAEHRGQELGWSVDDGVPSDNAAQNTVRQFEVGHRTLFEPQARMHPTGYRNHLRRQVNAKDGQSESVQMCRHVARAATDIGDRSTPRSAHQLGEGSEHRTVQRPGRELGAEAIGVVDGDGVVGLPGRAQVGRFGHVRDRSLVPSPDTRAAGPFEQHPTRQEGGDELDDQTHRAV